MDWFVKIYRAIAPFWRGISPVPTTCQFVPSCSEYAAQSFNQDGFFKGAWKSFKRILRCHPFSRGGVDLP